VCFVCLFCLFVLFVYCIQYTGIIAIALRVGQVIAAGIAGRNPEDVSIECNPENGISEVWYLILVPLSALGWSGLLNPDYGDLLLMTFNGILAFVIAWSLEQTSVNADLQLFLSALAIAFLSGVISRCTGKQSMGNTIAAVYVLLPDAYFVEQLFDSTSINFAGQMFYNAAIIGLGSWAGMALCSPLLWLGTTASARFRRKNITHRESVTTPRENSIRRNGTTGANLFD